MTRLFSFLFLRDAVIAVFWSFFAANLLSDGHTLAEASRLLGVFYLVVGFLEVPTGFVADYFGRKFSTLLGVGVMGLAFVVKGVSDDVIINIVAFGLAGFGMTLISGASTAWAFNVFQRLRAGNRSDHFFVDVDIVGRFGTITGALVGWLTTSYSPDLMWLVMGGLNVVAVWLGTGIAPDSVQECQTAALGEFVLGQSSFFKNVSNHFHLGIGIFLVATLLFGIETAIRNSVYQPFVQNLGTGDLVYLSYFQIINALTRMCGSFLFRKVCKTMRLGNWLMILGFIYFGAIQIFIGNWPMSFAHFAAVWGTAILFAGWFFPMKANLFNEMIPEKWRASFLSLDGMVESLAGSATCFAIARFLDPNSIEGLMDWYQVGGIMAIFSGVMLGVCLLVRGRSQVAVE